MNKINIKGVDETLLYEKMPNGLEVFMIPNHNVNNFYITFNTKYGSINTEFKLDGENKYTKIPDGVAHFLEHLMFKTKEGDAFDYFKKLGSQVNAYTSYNVTCYEVYAFDNFKENLNYLLDYVQTPYFTKENVKNEKGIIIEEIKMGENMPARILNNSLNQCLFSQDHMKNLITGTVDDIHKITVEDINNAYNTFYHPSNMFVIITGNFNPEEALAIIEQNQSQKEFAESKKIINKKVTEPISVVEKYKEIPTNVEVEKVCVSLKIPFSIFKNIKIDKIDLKIYLSMIMNTLYGNTSILRERLISGNIISSNLYKSRSYTDDYIIMNITAETPYPERFISIIKESFKNMEITEKDLTRKTRCAISNMILSFDDIDDVSSSIQNYIITNDEVIDNYFERYNNLNIDIANKIASLISDKNMTIIVLVPKKDK